MALREEGKERRRQRILDAAVDVLCDEGLSGLTIARIAERAQVSVATLYNLIGPLEEIIGAMVTRRFKEFEAIRLEPTEREDPVAAIYRLVDAMVEHFREDPARSQAIHRAIYQLNLSQGLSTQVTEAAERHLGSFRGRVEDLRRLGLIRPGANPGQLAEQMLTAQMSLLQAWSIGLVSLDHYQLSCRLFFATLLRAFATRKLAPRLDREMAELEAELSLEKASARRTAHDPTRARAGRRRSAQGSSR